jgi:hypothetical protein
MTNRTIPQSPDIAQPYPSTSRVDCDEEGAHTKRAPRGAILR